MNFDSGQLAAYFDQYGIPLLKALAVLVVGWIIAKIVAWVLEKGLGKTNWDNKLAAYVAGDRAKGLQVEKGIAKLVFWLIMLFVLVAVLQILGLTIITEPLNTLLTKIIGFLPNLLAAGALALIAWLVASALRIVVRNLLTAFQLDEKLNRSAGPDSVTVSLSKTLADAVYYLVFLLFLPQILDALAMDGLAPVSDMVGQILGFLPKLLGAAVVFFIFYIVARVVQRLTTNLLRSVGFDNLPQKLGFRQPEGRSASTIAGYIALIIILALGLVQALNTLQLATVSELAEELVAGLFNILIAGVIFAVGLFLSQLAYRALAREGRSHTLAMVVRAAILIFTGAMALNRANLAAEIVNLAFGALIVGLALAAGLAFGLGGREAAARAIESWREDVRSGPPASPGGPPGSAPPAGGPAPGGPRPKP